ncbi:MAG: cyclase family protein [Chitinispirillaceae bacterium]|nr:cyclase family protein [Chitinispirillaceae bacterium]
MARKIVDLTYPIHEGMTTYPKPWHPWVEITQLGRHGIENRETRKLVLGTHTGTHCDAPRHFIPEGKTLDQCNLNAFIGPASLVDFTGCSPHQQIGEEDLKRAIGERPVERVVLHFGWQRYWGSMNFYKNHPYLSLQAAEWLVKQGVVLVGMDTPMPDNPDPGNDSGIDSPIHKLFLSNDIVLVEYLCGLHEIGAQDFELVALPLKVKNSDGCPARCVAIIQ